MNKKKPLIRGVFYILICLVMCNCGDPQRSSSTDISKKIIKDQLLEIDSFFDASKKLAFIIDNKAYKLTVFDMSYLKKFELEFESNRIYNHKYHSRFKDTIILRPDDLYHQICLNEIARNISNSVDTKRSRDYRINKIKQEKLVSKDSSIALMHDMKIGLLEERRKGIESSDTLTEKECKPYYDFASKLRKEESSCQLRKCRIEFKRVNSKDNIFSSTIICETENCINGKIYYRIMNPIDTFPNGLTPFFSLPWTIDYQNTRDYKNAAKKIKHVESSFKVIGEFSNPSNSKIGQLSFEPIEFSDEFLEGNLYLGIMVFDKNDNPAYWGLSKDGPIEIDISKKINPEDKKVSKRPIFIRWPHH